MAKGKGLLILNRKALPGGGAFEFAKFQGSALCNQLHCGKLINRLIPIYTNLFLFRFLFKR
jgi:hypothetical protein